MAGPYRHGDIVGVNHLGREYLAFVEEDEGKDTLTVRPLTHGITWFTVKKREVRVIWRFARGVLPTVKNHGGVTWASD